jgi:hypothetical protein
MKRDMDLIRDILLEIEANDDVPSLDEKDDRYLQHLLLLQEAGLIAGVAVCVCDRGELYPQKINRPRLTWQGHEFLDAARNDTIWQRTMARLRDAGVSGTFDVVKALLIQAATAQLGLP